MPEIKRRLIPTEVNYGLLLVDEFPRDLLPQPRHKIVVVDVDGEKFEAKMHSSALRIDGLTQLHRKHKTSIGQFVTFEINPFEQGVVKVRFGGISDNKPISAILTQETHDSATLLKDDVSMSFDVILESIDNAILTLNHEGAKAFEKGEYEIARDLTEQGAQMKTYRDKLKEIRDDLHKILPTK